jgi:hypothetical protein
MNSIFYVTIKKASLSILGLTMKAVNAAEKYIIKLRNKRLVGIVVISATITNLLMILIAKKAVDPEWIFYRCVIVLTFLPWLKCAE